MDAPSRPTILVRYRSSYEYLEVLVFEHVSRRGRPPLTLGQANRSRETDTALPTLNAGNKRKTQSLHAGWVACRSSASLAPSRWSCSRWGLHRSGGGSRAEFSAAAAMGAYKYMEEMYKKKQSDVLRFLLRVRNWEWWSGASKGQFKSSQWAKTDSIIDP